MFEYWTVTTCPSLNARVVAMTAGARGPLREAAKARWTLGTAKRSAGPSTTAMIAIALRCFLTVSIFRLRNG